MSSSTRCPPRTFPGLRRASFGVVKTTTTGGTVLGHERHGVLQFRDIPYATAERFAPPQPVASDGARHGTEFGPTCATSPLPLELLLQLHQRQPIPAALCTYVSTPPHITQTTPAIVSDPTRYTRTSR